MNSPAINLGQSGLALDVRLYFQGPSGAPMAQTTSATVVEIGSAGDYYLSALEDPGAGYVGTAVIFDPAEPESAIYTYSYNGSGPVPLFEPVPVVWAQDFIGLVSVVAPTASNLVAPETALARLKLPESELDELAEQVAEASGLVARYLGFRPEFGTWQETFTGAVGDRLDLGARPAWGVLSVAYRDGSIHSADGYRLVRGPHGESSILRAGTPWGYAYVPEYAFTGPSLRVGGSYTIIPDWTVQYVAGWWLDEMGPTPPVGVEAFPAELRADFYKILRWLRATNSTNPAIRSMKDDGASVEFFGRDEQDVDAVTGIPCSCTRALQYYRRA
jgi:hypothetical protein